VGPASLTALQAELMAAAVVAAHNHVLRRWLRGESDDPVTEVDDALAHVVRLFSPPGESGVETGGGTTVVVLQSDRPLDEVLPALRRAVAGD
jgi:hypothetical protein